MGVIATARPDHPGFRHLLLLKDHFQISGPNGIHHCFVSEIAGPNIPTVGEGLFRDTRLPGRIAKAVAKQTLSCLELLHGHGIAHGDLHVGNLVFATPSTQLLSTYGVSRKLGKPDIRAVRRKDGKPLEPSLPPYLVSSTSFPTDVSLPSVPIKLIDFGEAYKRSSPPKTVRTPLVVRAPEALFKDTIDYRADIWSMGCILFQLVTGQPPFDNFFITPRSLVRQMLETTREELPLRWQPAWKLMAAGEAPEEPGQTLQEWLEEVYFEADGEQDFTREDIAKLGKLISRMLRLEPGARAAAKQILEDLWFHDDT